MMRRILTAFLLAACLSSTASAWAADASSAALLLPSACAAIKAGTIARLPPGNAGFSADVFSALLPQTGQARETSLHAANLRVTQTTGATSVPDLERAASAAAAATLIALTGRHEAGCPNRTLQDIAHPIVAGLQHGDSYQADWKDLTLTGASGHVSAGLMRLVLEAEPKGGLVHVGLSMRSITGVLKPAMLLPDRMLVDLSVPASSLPDLLATFGGGGSPHEIPLDVDRLLLSSQSTTITGHGTALSAPSLAAASTHLRFDATHYEALVKRVARLDLVRLHTALFLCQLVGRGSGDTLSWDVTFDHGVLAVNNLPIPLL